MSEGDKDSPLVRKILKNTKILKKSLFIVKIDFSIKLA